MPRPAQIALYAWRNLPHSRTPAWRPCPMIQRSAGTFAAAERTARDGAPCLLGLVTSFYYDIF